MVKSLKSLVLLGVVIMSASCWNNAGGERISLSENYSESVPAEKVFSIVNDAIELQEDTSFVLNTVKKIVAASDGVYLTDGTVICHYGQDGHLMSCISRQGRGSGEYMGIMDFDVDGNIVYVLDMNKKFIGYDSIGNLLQEKAMDFYPASFMIDDDRIVMTSAYQESGDKFIVLNKLDLRKIGSFFPINENELTWRHFMGQSNFFRYKDEVLFHEPMNCAVQTIRKDTVSVKYVFDFWNRNAPESFWREKHRDVFAINQEATANNYCYGIPYYAENDNAIVMTYRDGAFYRMLRYDKRKHQSVEFAAIVFPDKTEPVAIGDLCLQFHSESSMWIARYDGDGRALLYSVEL